MARPKSPASRKPRPSNRSPAVRSPGAPPREFEGDESELVVMGRIVGAFGVQGWLKVNPFTESPDRLEQFDRWLLRTGEGWREMAVEDFALHSKGPVAKLAGCDGREGADRLRGSDVAVKRGALGEAGEGSLFRIDLVGLEVVDESGALLGKVEGFFDTGETGVMVVTGARERMIPFIAEYVKRVDREAGRITVDWKADYDA